MKKRFSMNPFPAAAFFLCVFLSGSALGEVTIASIRGAVRVRRGLEEAWIRAGVGMRLQDIDTIMTEEASRTALELEDGTVFTMGGFSILDVSDLRRITERDLFLYLMSQKVSRIREGEGTPLRIQNVNVARAERKTLETAGGGDAGRPGMREREINGAHALYIQRFHTNAIVKFHKILEKYPGMDGAGRLYHYLGSAFEAIDEPGRAIDAYQESVSRAGLEGDPEFVRMSEEALLRLRE